MTDDLSQCIEKLGKRHARRFRALNGARPVGGQRGYRERHGDAMVAGRIDLGGVKTLAAGNVKTFRIGLDFHAHLPESGLDGGDAVGFLNPQLAGIAHGQPVVAGGPEHRQRRDFVDQRRGQRTFDHPASHRRGLHAKIANQLASHLVYFEDRDLRSHRNQKIEQRGARRIQADAVDHQARFLEQQRGDQKEAGRG